MVILQNSIDVFDLLVKVFTFCFAAGIVIEEKNWPPFFPIIHHDIANEIPIHLQRLQYVAFTTLLGMLFLFINVFFFFEGGGGVPIMPFFLESI